jgi:signal peptidase II
MSVRVKRWLLLLVLIAGVIAADQASKQRVIDTLQVGETVELVPALAPYFQITRSYNTGAAFGFLPEVGDIFLIIAVVVVIGLILFYERIPDDAGITRIATGLVCGGALGNAVDRIRHEHVVDFIHYRIPDVISNISNVADHAIVLGVILIFIDSMRLERAQRRAAATDDLPEGSSTEVHRESQQD